MKDPLGLSPSKGNQVTKRGKEKILPGRTEKVRDDLDGESRRRESKDTYNLHFRVNSLFTICVHSATRHNIHMYPYLR